MKAATMFETTLENTLEDEKDFNELRDLLIINKERLNLFLYDSDLNEDLALIGMMDNGNDRISEIKHLLEILPKDFVRYHQATNEPVIKLSRFASLLKACEDKLKSIFVYYLITCRTYIIKCWICRSTYCG